MIGWLSIMKMNIKAAWSRDRKQEPIQYYGKSAKGKLHSGKIRILALSWRDIKSPTAGGAEVNTHAIFKRLDPKIYSITHISPLYENLQEREYIDGITYIRHGNIFTVIPFAIRFYKKYRDSFDYVIDQCNTHRFFTPFWVKSDKRIFLIYQLTRDIWDINMRFPFSKIGKLMENLFLILNKNDITITESESTKQDLIKIGFCAKKIFIIPIIMNIDPWRPEEFLNKSTMPRYVYVGRYAKYKGIDFAVEAVGLLKKVDIRSQLIILGRKDQEYIRSSLLPICRKYNLTTSMPEEYHHDEDYHDADIVFAGYVSETDKLKTLSESMALIFPSNREGWGIPVSEAAYVGTPSIVFNSEGLIDAVDYGNAGYVCMEKSAFGIYQQMRNVLEDKDLYERIRKNSYVFTKKYLNVNVNELMKSVLQRQGNRK